MTHGILRYSGRNGTIYHIYLEDDDVGEVEGFFLLTPTTPNGVPELICTFCSNDANWRNEYMDPILTALGVGITHGYSGYGGIFESLEQRLKEHWNG